MVAEITKTLVDAVRPGMRACDINALNNLEWEKRGYDYDRKINWGGGRIGHGLGWGSCVTEPPHIAAYDTTEIRPGMVSMPNTALFKQRWISLLLKMAVKYSMKWIGNYELSRYKH